VIDSHCHLADEVFAADRRRHHAREGRGPRRAMTIPLPAARRKPRRRACRRHPLPVFNRVTRMPRKPAQNPQRAADIVREQVGKTLRREPSASPA
jgi:hypothetical protein